MIHFVRLHLSVVSYPFSWIEPEMDTFAPKNKTTSEVTGELFACTGYTRPGSCNDSIVASMIGCFAMPVNPSTRATSPAMMGSASGRSDGGRHRPQIGLIAVRSGLEGNCVGIRGSGSSRNCHR